jgi:hypothetical protein
MITGKIAIVVESVVTTVGGREVVKILGWPTITVVTVGIVTIP